MSEGPKEVDVRFMAWPLTPVLFFFFFQECGVPKTLIK
jgi:hypothetical protein